MGGLPDLDVSPVLVSVTSAMCAQQAATVSCAGMLPFSCWMDLSMQPGAPALRTKVLQCLGQLKIAYMASATPAAAAWAVMRNDVPALLCQQTVTF